MHLEKTEKEENNTSQIKNGQLLTGYSDRMETLEDEKVKAVKQDYEKFRSFFDYSPNAMMVVDLNGNLVDLNETMLRLFGFESEGQIDDAKEKITAKLKHLLPSLLDEVLKVGSIKNKKFEITRENGVTFFAEISANLVKGATGLPTNIIATIKDVSERKLLEDELQTSEEKFRAISNYAMEGIVLLDYDGRVVYWNPAAERIFGFSKDEITNKLLSDFLAPKKLQQSYKMFFEIMEGRIPGTRAEAVSLKKDGTEIPIDVSATSMMIKDKRYFLGIMRDISDRNKMENDLKRERDTLEAVTQNLGTGLIIVGKDYRILWANKFLKQYCDIENDKCYQTFNHLGAVCPGCGPKKIFEGENFDSREFYNDAIWLELISTPIKDKDGNVTAALELMVNIDEKKQLQNQLAKHNEELEHLVEERTAQLNQAQAKLLKSERLAAIGELAAMVGHDLRNPLTGIKAATFYLKTKTNMRADSKTMKILRTLDECVSQSDKIINDLLEYSRDLHLELIQTNPRELMDSSLATLIIPSNIRLIDDTECRPFLQVDKSKMVRACQNLMKNAFDAMPDGGVLTVTSKQVDDNLVLSFADTGIGMSNQTISKLGSSLFTTKAKGMGFGLSICKRMIEAHGGKLAIESTLGKGTTITITIPITIPLTPKPSVNQDSIVVFQETCHQQ